MRHQAGQQQATNRRAAHSENWCVDFGLSSQPGFPSMHPGGLKRRGAGVSSLDKLMQGGKREKASPTAPAAKPPEILLDSQPGIQLGNIPLDVEVLRRIVHGPLLTSPWTVLHLFLTDQGLNVALGGVELDLSFTRTRVAPVEQYWTEGGVGVELIGDGCAGRHFNSIVDSRRFALRSVRLNCASLPQVQSINFHWSKSLNSLSRCTLLKSLQLDQMTGIRDIDPLRRCSDLRDVYLSGCSMLTDITALGSSTKLCEVGLSGCNELQHVTALEKCPMLRTIYMDGANALKNISPLSKCPCLRELYLLDCCKLKSISAVQGCNELRIVNLSRCCELQSISALASKEHLVAVNLESCILLQDVVPLKTCTALATLNRTHITVDVACLTHNDLWVIPPRYVSLSISE